MTTHVYAALRENFSQDGETLEGVYATLESAKRSFRMFGQQPNFVEDGADVWRSPGLMDLVIRREEVKP